MAGNPIISEAAIAELKAGRKTRAIRIIREDHKIGLKESKEVAESFLARHPELNTPPVSSVGVIVVALGVIAIYLGYKYLTG